MSNYNFSLTTFSPSGKLGQIEHALAAVNKGATAVGIKAADCVVLACIKKPSSTLIDLSSLSAVEVVCGSIGMTYSGMGPDFRLLVAKARKIAQEYIRVYQQDPPTIQLVKRLAGVIQDYTQSGGVRPFGVSLLIAGFDSESGPSLYQVDPSGSYFPWKATAIGKTMVESKTFLEKRYTNEIGLEDAIHTAIMTLKEGFEGQLAQDYLDIGIISTETMVEFNVPGKEYKNPEFRKLSKADIHDHLANIV
ncbi:putative proteasome subunit alpha type-2 [Smittium culicis]|uniref:Proteasome subunit alpha type n=2 Tax=Smittium culicis TaxID=133412 RepID=A0A1R1YMB5_9FUNG|nr:putative proteasome subunit alpha type-2 [Smittium culicis]OMJ28061.1 putative proteasome subunit alpha type-2 [Smittium culicis]